MNLESSFNFTFFGSSRLSVIVLTELAKAGHVPTLIVTTPDKPQGRKLVLTPNVVKSYALENGIPVETPAKLDAAFIERLRAEASDLYIVASYGKIIPNTVIDLPPHKTLNIHPSLLPRYRGPSPLPTAMLDDARETGVTIMRLDAEMDHGPIVAQEKIAVNEWPTYEDFEEMMAKSGARLLAETMPGWVAGTIAEKAQDHASATYTKKIAKEDGLIEYADILSTASDPAKAYDIFRKIQAYHEWPQAYFFIQHGDKQIRVKITQASFRSDAANPGGQLVIEKVIPEGKKEMLYVDFVRGYQK